MKNDPQCRDLAAGRYALAAIYQADELCERGTFAWPFGPASAHQPAATMKGEWG